MSVLYLGVSTKTEIGALISKNLTFPGNVTSGAGTPTY